MTAATSVSTKFLWYSALALLQDHTPWFSLIFGLGTSPAHSAITIAPYTSFFLLRETAAVPVSGTVFCLGAFIHSPLVQFLVIREL